MRCPGRVVALLWFVRSRPCWWGFAWSGIKGGHKERTTANAHRDHVSRTSPEAAPTVALRCQE